MKSQKAESYQHRLALTEYIEQYQSEDLSDHSRPQITYWYPVSIDNKVFLIEILYYNQTYMGAWITDTQLLNPLSQLEVFENSTFLLYPLDSEDYFLLNNGTLSDSDYIYSHSDSSCGNFNLTVCIPEDDFLQKTMPLRHIFYWLCVISFFLLFVTMLLLSHQIFPSLQRMLLGILAVKQGDFSTQIPLPATHDEFAQVTTAFNEMIQEIQDLKMKVYEEKLEKTNTQIQYLTIDVYKRQLIWFVHFSCRCGEINFYYFFSIYRACVCHICCHSHFVCVCSHTLHVDIKCLSLIHV